MDIFISWAGPQSKAVASLLHKWLPDVIQALRPFISHHDIDYGLRWLSEIGAKLNSSDYGIICVTPSNLAAPWLMFEAGALAKAMDQARVVPLAIGLDKNQLPPPLSQFQGLEPTREDLLKLVKQINARLMENTLPVERLELSFASNWERFERELAAVPTEEGQAALPPPSAEMELLAEIRNHTRLLVSEAETRQRFEH